MRRMQSMVQATVGHENSSADKNQQRKLAKYDNDKLMRLSHEVFEGIRPIRRQHTNVSHHKLSEMQLEEPLMADNFKRTDSMSAKNPCPSLKKIEATEQVMKLRRMSKR